MSPAAGGAIDQRRDGAPTVEAVAETAMVVDVDLTAGAGGDAGAVREDGGTRSSGPEKLALAVVVAIATVAVAVVAAPSRAVHAELLGPVGDALPGAPASAIVHRWTRALTPGDDVALVAGRVVLMDAGPDPGVTDTIVTARDVRSEAVAWRRRLAARAVAMVVDDEGAATTMYGSRSSVGSVEPQRLVALDADDGRLLWERPVSFVIGSSSGHVLLATDGGCDLVEARSGRTTWHEWTQRCWWLDHDEVMASRRGGWEVHALDGTTTRRLPGTEPPAAVDEFVAAVDDDDLVLLDQAGGEQWRTSIARAATAGRARLRGLSGLGVVVSGEGATQTPVEVFDLFGAPQGRAGEVLADASVVEVDGTPFVVARRPDGDQVALSIRPVDDPEREVGAITSSYTLLTGRGVLAAPSSGDRVALLAWPDLSPVWSADLGHVVGRDGEGDEVLTSDVGLVVISSDPAALHAYG